MAQEIEHKYLLDSCPDFVLREPPTLIEQGWLARLRLRKKVSSDGRTQCFGCLKFGSGLSRAEFEYRIPALVFSALWPLTRGRRVRKHRYAVTVTTPRGERSWEVDVFLDRALFLAEIEVRDAREGVDLPDWLASRVVREVTEDPDFTNFALRK